MLYKDATKAIKNLSKKYSVLNDGDFYDVLYNGLTVLGILKRDQYCLRINIDRSYFDGLPFSHKLWMIASELAMTPLDGREDEPKFRVKMLPNSGYSYLNQCDSDKNLHFGDGLDYGGCKTIFTKSEYDKLYQEYPKWLPKFNKYDLHFKFVKE